jgi:iron complex outermembrane receptor protein
MSNIANTKRILSGVFCVLVSLSGASAMVFKVPGGDLEAALTQYSDQSGIALAVPYDAIKHLKTKGVSGDLSADAALAQLLKGTGFVARHDAAGVVQILPGKSAAETPPVHVAASMTPTVSGASLETVTVTSSKIGGNVQNIPISITALSQEQLTATQTAGGPDLVKQVPNMTFTKTNFSGYSIQLRGIGTQAISVSTDPAVAVALNDIPFIRNHFFEQEFYDLSQAEVLRGPQGTLYGRNATAGVVNLVTAKPSDQFEAMVSLEIGNYGERRPEGMINIPIVDDRLDVRVAGEWTKRQGYSFNQITNQRIDGRDLWSGRVTIGWKPSEKVQTYLVWEHFSEDDDRMRTSKQLCETAPLPGSIDGVSGYGYGSTTSSADYVSQGCEMTSLYSPSAFEVPNGYSLSYYAGLTSLNLPILPSFNVYGSTIQSRNLRDIEATINPVYRAKNDTLELNTDYNITPTLTVTSQTGYNSDFLWSTEDYNRFNSVSGAFTYYPQLIDTLSDRAIFPDPSGLHICTDTTNENCGGAHYTNPCDPSLPGSEQCTSAGEFCDPQLGCSDRLVAEDLSDEHAWQLSQEFRLASNFSGPLNFSIGGSYLHYETEENYYVFINTLSLFSLRNGTGLNPQPFSIGGGTSYRGSYVPGVSDNSECLPAGYRAPSPSNPSNILSYCPYMDPNPLSKLNNEGHNYFLSQNPYVLNSYAGFGEAYYNVTKELKLTAGLRWTDDQKHFVDIPSELLVPGYGYTVTEVVNQQWDQVTGRAAVNWMPKLDFTDQTLVYGSYAHGYKAGGANPPGAVFPTTGELPGANNVVTDPIHPLTFKPEFIDAFELGSKNTLLDGSLTFNADVFYYNYENYQISRIVDRTAINDNFDAHVKGAEVESTWEPIPGLRFNFGGGWEDTALAKGSHSIDLMDRTAGNPDWIVIKPFVTTASNCVLPTYVAAVLLNASYNISAACVYAYGGHVDPVTGKSYQADPLDTNNGNGPITFSPYGVLTQYPGFDPLAGTPGDPYTGQNKVNGIDYGPAPNNGEGFDKDLSGHQLPNAPPFTVSFGTQYTLPITEDWAGTLRGDYYWQDYSWARVFNDNPYDRLRGYTNVNLTLIFTNQNGWQVMLFDKNVFNETAITGDFLNSDDSALTTNVFLTDPKLIGVRVTKNW